MTTCPACQRDVPEEEQTCPYCGVVFAKLKPRPTPSPSEGTPIEQTAQSVSRAMELSPEEKNRIYLEEKARLEAQERIKKELAQQEVESQERIRKMRIQGEQATARKRRPVYGALAGTFLLFVAFCSYFTSEQSPPRSHIPYVVVESWSIPAGGYGRVVVVDPKYRNESDLRALGETLRYDTRGDQFAFVHVYDDYAAAWSRKEAQHHIAMDDSESHSELVVNHQRHYIAEYSRNGNTGHHQFYIMLDGMDGDVSKDIKVKY